MEEEKKNTVEPAGDPKKMKACKTCGTMIAKNAKRCPSCGAKNKKPIYKRLWFWILVIAVVGVIIGVIKDSQPIDYDNPAAKVTTDDIVREFHKNEANAKSKYGDKTVAVTGKVSTVKDDHIVLSVLDNEFFLFGVDVFFEDSADVKSAVVGKYVTAVGRCSSSLYLGNVQLKHAKYNSAFEVTPDYNGATKVELSTLLQAYKDNSVAANDSYRSKTIEVTGVVDYIGTEYIVLRTKKLQGLDDLADMDNGATVYFEDEADLKKVKDGQKITVAGFCVGDGIVYNVSIQRAVIK